MLFDLLGVQQLDFTAQDGRQITGKTLFVAHSDERVIGKRTDKLFLNPSVPAPKSLTPGMTLDISFNQRGKIESVEEADAIDV